MMKNKVKKIILWFLPMITYFFFVFIFMAVQFYNSFETAVIFALALIVNSIVWKD